MWLFIEMWQRVGNNCSLLSKSEVVALSSSGKVRTKPRTLQEFFVKGIEGAAAKPVLPWLFSGWAPLSVGLGKVTQGRAAKREAVLTLYIVDPCRHTQQPLQMPFAYWRWVFKWKS